MKEEFEKLAREAWNEIIGSIVVCSCSPQQYELATSRILAAIEKSHEVKDDLVLRSESDRWQRL